MLDITKRLIHEKFNIYNGYKYDSDVIYGDTDSVMIKFGNDSREEAINLGKEAAQLVTSKFKEPIRLEFEKVYHPFLLMNKKRYAGMHWSNPDKPDKIDCKGIETVRRDNCELVQLMVKGSLDRLLTSFDKQGAVEYAKGMVNDLLQNRVDLSLLIITKGLSKKIANDSEEEEPGVTKL